MLNLKRFKRSNKLILKLNDSNIDYYIKNTRKLIKYCDNNQLILEIFYNNSKLSKKDLNKKIDNKIRDIITISYAINLKDKYKRFNYIYDTVCSYLDKEIESNNYCKFINNICIRDRLKDNNHNNGCCESIKRGKCKYLINNKCILNSCIACKLFTCKTLREKGFKYNLNDYVLTKYFFTLKQKNILQFSFWTSKKIIIDRLIKNKYIRP